MKAYTFAPISAREYPTVSILDNPFIWGGVSFCVNLSERPYSSELIAAFAQHGIEWIHCPISEEAGADWLPALSVALPKMYLAYKAEKRQIVHCGLGNNRSRSFAEALYYAINRKELSDPYKGEVNHLIYNCKIGHLPEINELEYRLVAMTGFFPNWHIPSEEKMRDALVTPRSSQKKGSYSDDWLLD